MQTARGRRTYVPGSGHWQIEFVSQPTWLLDNSGAIVFSSAGGAKLPKLWVDRTEEGEMKSTHARRGLRVTLTVLGVGLLTAVISAAGGLAHAAVNQSSQAPKACV